MSSNYSRENTPYRGPQSSLIIAAMIIALAGAGKNIKIAVGIKITIGVITNKEVHDSKKDINRRPV